MDTIAQPFICYALCFYCRNTAAFCLAVLPGRPERHHGEQRLVDFSVPTFTQGPSLMSISTKPASGFRDFLPGDMRQRQRVFQIIREVYQAHGFEELDTPCFERLDTQRCQDPI